MNTFSGPDASGYLPPTNFDFNNRPHCPDQENMRNSQIDERVKHEYNKRCSKLYGADEIYKEAMVSLLDLGRSNFDQNIAKLRGFQSKQDLIDQFFDSEE